MTRYSSLFHIRTAYASARVASHSQTTAGMSATAAAPQAFDAVLAAMNMMQSNVGQDQKKAAHEFLENFQKSVRAELLLPELS